MNPVRSAVIDAGVLELGRFNLDNGKRANNRLNFDQLFVAKNKPYLDVVLHHMAHVADRFQPKMLVGISSHGSRFADALSKTQYLGVGATNLQITKNEQGQNEYSFRSENDSQLVSEVDKLILVEGAFSNFHSALGALAIDGVAQRAQAAVGIWDRGYHPSRIALPIPVEAMVAEFIPNILNVYSSLYSHGKQV